MTKNTNINAVGTSPDYHKWTLYLLLGLGLARLVGLYLSPLNLHGDEAQYWAWSRNLDWGYYSKPPMIAWVIGATTALFGNAEWAVRISSPLLHPLIAYILFRTARFLYDARTGFWTACAYFLMPAVWLSSGIVSTDVVLLVFWALGLNAFFHLRETPAMKWALLLGLAIGFGMLSKYAMLFFLPALGIAILIDAKTRRALLSLRGVVVALMSLLVLSPNIWWNAVNDFSTISHTAANANLKGIPFHPLELLEFWASQLGVFGPVMLVLLVMALVAALRGKLERKTLLLSLFVLSPLAVISLEALLSRANANWAVTAYAGGAILAGRYGSLYWPRFIKAGVWVNVALGSIMVLGALVPSFADMVGQANAFKRLRGWPQTQTLIAKAANAGHEGQAFGAITTDNRLVFYDMIYYGLEQNTGLALRMWRLNTNVNNHAEANVPLEAGKLTDAPVLMINYYMGYEDKFRDDFKRLEFIDTLDIDLGGGKTRTLKLWAGYGYTPTDVVGRK
ncbi:MAG: glycosyltransferase family 39 protein [Robiginitomaculum sp.]|nr:glycosyltransferase family 39 protein [Robiginitomaculum sp.]